jgi:rhodanese-related sulfurtransferase
MMTDNSLDPVADAKTRIREVTPSAAMNERSEDTVFLDVREANEWNLGHIPGATFIPLGEVESKVEHVIPRDRKVVVYCARGNRSAVAADRMQKMGYTDVTSMSSGIAGWADAGGEIE